MLQRTLSALVAASLIGFAGSAIADVNYALNNLSVYGNIGGITDHGGQTSGGVGVKASAYTDNWLLSADWHHDFSSLFAVPGATGGGANFVNVKAGYLIPFSSNFAVGPYATYQYTRFSVNGPSGDGSFHLTNNAIGGGLMGALAAGPLSFVGHIGYLGGVSATYSYTDNGYRYAVSSSSGSLNVLSLGVQANYRVAGPWYLFTGFDWDRYSNHGSDDLLQGDFGLGYSF